MKLVSSIICLLISGTTWAGDCLVQTNLATGPGSLAEAIDRAGRRECQSSLSPEERDAYEAFVPVTPQVQRIRISKSGSIALTTALPAFTPSGDTLLIQASPDVQFQLSGAQYNGNQSPVVLGGHVIWDGIGLQGFVTTAVQFTGHDNLLIHSSIAQSGTLTSPAVRVEGEGNAIVACTVSHSQGVAILWDALRGMMRGNDIHHNLRAGVQLLRAANLRQNRIHHNADGILAGSFAPPPPVDLIDVAPEAAEYHHLIGSIGQGNTINLKDAIVEVFITDHAQSRQATAYLTDAKITDIPRRLFSIQIPKPLIVDGREIEHPIFVATLVDPEHHATSRYSDPVDVEATRDWDRDGVVNAEEDNTHTDPRLPDSDGDGLNDGQEHQQLLNPMDADTDDDCLPDGLELGVTASKWPMLPKTEFSILKAPVPEMSSTCLGILKLHKLDPAKRVLSDSDPSHVTDPGNPDSDGDKLMDGAEDWNWDGARNLDATGLPLETDPGDKDSDHDDLPDGAEDRNNDGALTTGETSPLIADSDHDGVPDAQEVKGGGNPTHCDSDADKLPDGIENNLANTDAPEGCEGRPNGGSNFANPHLLSSHNPDSDGDGLNDGDEDANHNGWLDPLESDPTTTDTDKDGISDGIEATGDTDHDGVADFALEDLNGGSHCNPPEKILDIDCDGLANAQDSDSDNDGCADRIEGLDPGASSHSIPAAYNKDLKQCTTVAMSNNGGGGGLTGGGSHPSTDSSAAADAEWNALWKDRTDGGGDCSLIPQRNSNSPYNSVFLLAALHLAVVVAARILMTHAPHQS